MHIEKSKTTKSTATNVIVKIVKKAKERGRLEFVGIFVDQKL